MSMWKKVFSISLAILTGILLSFPVLFVNQKRANSKLTHLYVLQTGVFENYKNAVDAQKKVKNSIIYPDGNLYRVLVGASLKEESLLKVERVLKEECVDYYKKEIQIIEDDLFSEYNIMLDKAENKETILLLNQKILEKMVRL